MKLIKKIIFISLLPLRSMLRFFRDFFDLAKSIARLIIKKPYQVNGRCLKRGVCCQNLAIHLSATEKLFQLMSPLIKTWYEFVYHFKLKEVNKDKQVFVFRCRYLKNNLCSIHWRRPLMCRQYPYVHPYIQPKFLPGCGYALKEDDS